MVSSAVCSGYGFRRIVVYQPYEGQKQRCGRLSRVWSVLEYPINTRAFELQQPSNRVMSLITPNAIWDFHQVFALGIFQRELHNYTFLESQGPPTLRSPHMFGKNYLCETPEPNLIPPVNK